MAEASILHPSCTRPGKMSHVLTDSTSKTHKFNAQLQDSCLLGNIQQGRKMFGLSNKTYVINHACIKLTPPES